MDYLSKQFAFLAELFIDFNKSVDDSVAAPAPLSPKRALGHFLFYSKGGERILCNPNPLDHPNPFLPPVLAVLCPTRDIMSPKSGRPLFSLHPQDSTSIPFPGPFFRPRSRFFAPNLNLYLALLSAILLTDIFLLLWWDWLFLIRSSFIGMTDKGKPFERMGRKTTDLSNGGWVAELTSRISLAHSFEVKTGLFFMRNPGAIRRSIMNVPRSLVIKHTELDPSYIPLAYRREVLSRDQGRCHFCHEPTSYLCHDLAKCRGGQTTPDNLLTCCMDCRREKGELTAAEYFEVRLKEENIFKEATSVFIKVYYISGRSREGEVEAEPSLNSREFYMKVGNNGKIVKVNTANVEDIEILGGKEKK